MAEPMTFLELRDAIAKAIADAIGHGMREKCERHADAVLAVVGPQLLATAEHAERIEADEGAVPFGWVNFIGELSATKKNSDDRSVYLHPPAQAAQGACSVCGGVDLTDLGVECVRCAGKPPAEPVAQPSPDAADSGRVDEILAHLKDPANVHVMMLRGVIAVPSIRSMVDLRGEVLNGEDVQLARIAELQEQLAARGQGEEFDMRKYVRHLADVLEAGIGLWKVDADLQRLAAAINANESAPPTSPAGVPEGWRDDVSLAAQMLTWGADEGLTESQEREVHAHQAKLFAMLTASQESQPNG